MATFKKRFTIIGLNDYIDPPERQRCGTALCYLSKLMFEFEEKSKQEFFFEGKKMRYSYGKVRD